MSARSVITRATLIKFMAKKKKKKQTGEGPGRPTVFTPDVVQKLESAFSLGATYEEAAAFAGISKRALFYHLEENEEFLHRIEAHRDSLILKARTTMVNNLQDPQWAKWYLERKAKKEFSTRLEHSGPDGGPMPFSLTSLFDAAESHKKAKTKTE